MSTDSSRDNNTANLEFPFPSEHIASVVYNSLRIDEEPKRSKVTKELWLERNIMKVKLQCEDVKNLKKSVNHLFDMILLIMETVAKFGQSSSSVDSSSNNSTSSVTDQNSEGAT